MMQTEIERLERERYELTIALARCIRAKNIALMCETKSKIRIVENILLFVLFDITSPQVVI